MIYKIIVKDNSGNQIGEFQTFRNLKFNKELNYYGTCTFDIPANDTRAVSLISLRRYTVHIYRDGVLIWAGEQALRNGSLDNKGNNWITIQCYDWFEQLYSRYTGAERIFTGVDAGLIAWTLIDESQSVTNGSFGITQGTIVATKNRDRTYNNKNIGDAIVQLANVIEGFDFEINTSKAFGAKAQIGVDRTASVVFEYGVNISSVKIIEDYTNPVNKAIILGDSGTYTDPLRVERENVTLEATYKIREALSNEMSVIETSTLEDKGDAILRKYGNVLTKLSMKLVRGKIEISDFALGDTIRAIIKSGLYDIDDTYRINEWSINFGEDDTETLDLVLSKFILI